MAPNLTQLLHAVAEGDAAAGDRLYPLVYDELRALAHRHLRNERANHTLATTALVHEAYLRLVDVEATTWQDRAHFFAFASRVMRRVLIDWARARVAAKRGSGAVHAGLASLATGLPDPSRPETLLALDEALDRLAERAERAARVVECRYFAGLTIDETAAALGVSDGTVKADWRAARAWLLRQLAAPEA